MTVRSHRAFTVYQDSATLWDSKIKDPAFDPEIPCSNEVSIFNEDAAYDEETGEVSHVHPVSGGRGWAACYSGRSEQGGLNELRHLNKNEPVFRV